MDQPAVPDLLSRAEVLRGLPARRASTLLYAIECRTAQRMVRTRQATARLATERTSEQQERVFLDALAKGRELPIRLSIQDVERYAADWAMLVPPDPAVRAALGALLGNKYAFRHKDVPRLRGVLGLDTTQVADAYTRQHGAPLARIFATRTSWRERRRWLLANAAQHLEALPPFWTVFALTLTEMIGAAILALPTAVAGIGPLIGVALLLALGVINVITIAGLSEAFARDGNVRYGHLYFGRLVTDFLGNDRSPLVTRLLLGLVSVLLVADCVGSLLAYCIGITSTLAEASGVSAAIWGLLLLAVVLYFLRRETLELTIASAMLIGAINLSLLVLLILLVLPHVNIADLLATNLAWSTPSPVDPAMLGLIFGVILAAYFGHFSTGTCARLVLNRDPSGRSLVLGNVAAMSVAIVLNCSWVIAVNGTVAPSALLGQSGPAINLLATEVGPFVSLIGVVFVVLGMGIGSIHAALAVMFQVREWLAVGRSPAATVRTRDAGVVIASMLRLRQNRFLLGAVPVTLIFSLAEWLLAQGVSFAGPLGFLGVLAYSVLGGILPALMLFAGRRKGDYVPAVAWRVVGHPVVVVVVYALFTASFFVHGLLIWDEPVQRLAAVGLGAVLVVLTILVIRHGAFAPRATVELRVDGDPDEPGLMAVSVVDCGRVGTADVQLKYGLRRTVGVDVHAAVSRRLKVWVHGVTASGDSVGLPARVEIREGGNSHLHDLSELTPQIVVALNGAAYHLSIEL